MLTTIVSRVARVMAAALALVAAACGSPDRPGPAVDTASDPVSVARGAVPVARSTDTCSPLSTRECRVYYRDEHGQLHCPVDIEVCRPDGKGFFACGEYDLDDGGLTLRADNAGR